MRKSNTGSHKTAQFRAKLERYRPALCSDHIRAMLTDTERPVVEHLLAGFSVAETVEMLGKTKGSVHGAIYRAMKIADAYQPKEETPTPIWNPNPDNAITLNGVQYVSIDEVSKMLGETFSRAKAEDGFSAQVKRISKTKMQGNEVYELVLSAGEGLYDHIEPGMNITISEVK